jgi:hypothetical protein
MRALAGDREDAVLERLSQRLEDGARELGQLVHEKNPAVRECAGMSLEGMTLRLAEMRLP